ncbi:MAG: PorV/PorQ family protein [Ignavibacteriaceae bacterium]
MKSIIRFLLMVSVLLLGADSIYAGGGNRTGTGGAAQLLIPVGTRGIAMGGSNIATATGIEALFWNPAGAAKVDGSATLLFSHMNYIADIGVEYGAVSANFEGFGVLSFSVKSLSIGDIAVTTNTAPDGTGQVYTPQELVAGVTFSKQLTDRIGIGITANYVTEKLDQASASGFAFNVGVAYNDLADISGLSFGIVLNNIGPQMKFDGPGLLQSATASTYNRPPGYFKVDAAPFDLPTNFQLGLSYSPQIDDVNSLTISSLFQNNNFSEDEYKVGLEYGYDNLVFLRGGYTAAAKSSDQYIYGFSAGVGINYDLGGVDVKVDYAYRDVDFFGGNHVFGIALGF